MAYSTVSQLGYMFMALGAGVEAWRELAIVAAMFHLFTHAFFKALLFLASGSVMHAMGDVIDMRRFRGLRHRLPYTHDVRRRRPCPGGYPSAGRLLQQGRDSGRARTARRASGHSGVPGSAAIYLLIYALAIGTAFLTAFYTGRAYFLTFWGPEKTPYPRRPHRRPIRETCRRRAQRP